MTDTADTANEQSRTDEFYVGYLPLPRSLKRFLIVVVPVLLAGLVGGASLIASGQSSAGGGHWEYGVERIFEGYVVGEPYPLMVGVHPFDKQQSATYIIVSEGKHGSQDRFRKGGSGLMLRGTLLDREGRFLIELASKDSIAGGIRYVNDIEDRLWKGPFGTHTLRGEIIDPKCYLGAMKPGGGRTHRACATLCIRGGIPPMFVTRDAEFNETYYLLTNESGGAILEEIVPFIGEPVEVTGELHRIGDLNVLRLDVARLRRL